MLNLLNVASVYKIVSRKQNIVNHKSNVNDSVGNEIIYGTEVLQSDLCDYNNAWALVRDNITIIRRNLVTEVTHKNCTPFIKCITKFYGKAREDAENLDLIVLMYLVIVAPWCSSYNCCTALFN